MIKSFSTQKSSNKPQSVFVTPALEVPHKTNVWALQLITQLPNLPRKAKKSSVLALLQYGRCMLIKRSSDFFENTFKPIIEPSQFEKGEALRFLDQQMAVLPCP